MAASDKPFVRAEVARPMASPSSKQVAAAFDNYYRMEQQLILHQLYSAYYTASF